MTALSLARGLGLETAGCVSGMLSGAWVLPEFEPVGMVPSGTKLTSFHSDDYQGSAGMKALRHIVDCVEPGDHAANVDRVFTIDEIAEAHRYVESNRAAGKVVVFTDQ
jgi:NADPH:quinone reductase-like Zn-dependent oxidoreductase